MRENSLLIPPPFFFTVWHLERNNQIDWHLTRHAESISRFWNPSPPRSFSPRAETHPSLVVRNPPTFESSIPSPSSSVHEFRLYACRFRARAHICDLRVRTRGTWIRYPRDLITSLCLDEAVSGIELSDSCVSHCNWLLPRICASFVPDCLSYIDFFSL